MKTNLTRTLILTAVALTGAAAAHAQEQLAANVPFAFQAVGQKFDAGTYYISEQGLSGSGILTLFNRNSGNSKFVNTVAPGGGSKNRNPRLVFLCGDQSGCALSAVQLADGRAWKIRIPRLEPSEADRISVIYLERKQAE